MKTAEAPKTCDRCKNLEPYEGYENKESGIVIGWCDIAFAIVTSNDTCEQFEKEEE